MPKQISPVVKLKGTIDQLSFYKSQDGFMARQKGGVSGDRLKSDPKFDQTRRAMSEFSIAGKAGKALRSTLNNELGKAADNRVASRLTRALVAVLKTDTVSDFGFRKVENGDLTTLTGFEFNTQVPFSAAIKVPFAPNVDRATGQVSINLASHLPKRDIGAPDNATHYSFFAAAVAMDFATGEASVARQSVAALPWNTTPTTASNISLALPAESPFPVLILLGVEFSTLINNKQYPVSKGLSTLQVLDVSMP